MFDVLFFGESHIHKFAPHMYWICYLVVLYLVYTVLLWVKEYIINPKHTIYIPVVQNYEDLMLNKKKSGTFFLLTKIN